MRQQVSTMLYNIMSEDEHVVVLLGDVGAFLFRDIFADFPDRIYNLGICEQATVGVAAGLSKSGFIPTFYGIAPFVVERALEQIKIDFGYQKLKGNFITVGNSYDYTSLGCTHHCPADVRVIQTIPDMNIFVPGNSEEFDYIYRSTYNKGLSYYRLSEHPNIGFTLKGETVVGCLMKEGSLATVIAVGTMLDAVLSATRDLDVSVLYYTQVRPFDKDLLIKNLKGDTIFVCEPYYEGALDYDICCIIDKPIRIKSIGVPHIFLTKYGTKKEMDEWIGLTPENIRNVIKESL